MSYAAVVNGGSLIGNNFGRYLAGGFLAHALFMPILTFALTPESKGRAVCGNAARTDLCRGVPGDWHAYRNPERQFKPRMDGGLRAAILVSPLLHLRTAEFLSKQWGPPHNPRLPLSISAPLR